MRGVDNLASCSVAAAMACKEKSWVESITQEGSRSQANLLLVCNMGVHGPKHTVFPLKSGSCHEADEIACDNDIEMLDGSDSCIQG